MRRRRSDPLSLWFAQVKLAQDMAITGAQASLVMSSRLATMAAEGANPTAAGRRDAERMVSEKMQACVDGAAGAWQAGTRAALAGTFMTPEAALAVTNAAIRPARRAVAANARRIGRR